MAINETNAMGLLTHGVYVIGTNNGKKKNLMTAAWVSQASSRPNMLVLAVSEKHYTAELIKETGHFSVSVLTEEQKDIAIACGSSSGRDTDKLKGLDIGMTPESDPVINGACAHLSCEVTDTFKASDHVLFVAKVVNSKVFSSNRMIFTRDLTGK